MKGIICREPGNLAFLTLEKPELKAGHSIIKIQRIGICGTDLHAFEGTQPYFQYPRILGHELAATFVEGDPEFKSGEKVTLIPYYHCGNCIACTMGKPNCCAQMQVPGVHVDGGMVQYMQVPSYALLHGEGLSLDELVLAEPLAIGAHGVRRAGIIPGEFVLVMGAGPIGLGIMEFATIAGGQVIALDLNPQRLAFCQENLKVPFIINGSHEPVRERLMEITRGQMPSVVIDATGSRHAINAGFLYLSHGGRYVLVGLQKGDICVAHPEFHKRETTLMSSRNATKADFQQVMDALKSGTIRPGTYITHRIPFDVLPEAFTGLLDPTAGVIKAIVEMD